MIESIVLFIGGLLAGLSALVFKPSELLFKVLLAFGGAFLLGLSFFHLLPEAYEAIGMQAGLAVISGFILQVVLESFSGGIEHGHHHHEKGNNFPWMVFVGLSLHAYLEGLPFGQHDQGFTHFLLPPSLPSSKLFLLLNLYGLLPRLQDGSWVRIVQLGGDLGHVCIEGAESTLNRKWWRS